MSPPGLQVRTGAQRGWRSRGAATRGHQAARPAPGSPAPAQAGPRTEGDGRERSVAGRQSPRNWAAQAELPERRRAGPSSAGRAAARGERRSSVRQSPDCTAGWAGGRVCAAASRPPEGARGRPRPMRTHAGARWARCRPRPLRCPGEAPNYPQICSSLDCLPRVCARTFGEFLLPWLGDKWGTYEGRAHLRTQAQRGLRCRGGGGQSTGCPPSHCHPCTLGSCSQCAAPQTCLPPLRCHLCSQTAPNSRGRGSWSGPLSRGLPSEYPPALTHRTGQRRAWRAQASSALTPMQPPRDHRGLLSHQTLPCPPCLQDATRI